ncbi:MAG TPA: SAM-dependent methyltransferase [Acidimicrobiia bacterium]|nr:SAM-dependent methyltransferase [Acidimicrobiia bacterium]
MVAAEPSPWVARFAPLVPAGGRVLDVAAGRGRHTRFFRARRHPVTAVDRDTAGLADLGSDAGVEIVERDLEAGAPFPFGEHAFAGVVVTNYLHRPLLPAIVGAVAGGGVLLYETFARGQERFGRPQRPEFLLEPGELLEAVRGELRVVAYEDVVLDDPPRAVQHIAARREP